MRVSIVAAVLLIVALFAAVGYKVFGPEAPPPAAPAEEPEIVHKAERIAAQLDEDPMPAPTGPSFDVVRIDPTGSAVVAGRADPGSIVSLIGNGKTLGTATADPRGEWTMIVDAPLDEGDQRLTLQSVLPDGTQRTSSQEVVVAVPERPGRKPLVVLGGAEVPSKVLQTPADGVASGGLVVESIDYDEAGDVSVSGMATPEAVVRAYLDQRAVGTTRAGDSGRWTVLLEGIVPPGRYTLRVDELGVGGAVRQRVELPFERASPEDLLFADGQVVVQPGNNLWRIARFVYGSGFKYTVIYSANQSEIRDPDLIYPGQIFSLPNDRAPKTDASEPR